MKARKCMLVPLWVGRTARARQLVARVMDAASIGATLGTKVRFWKIHGASLPSYDGRFVGLGPSPSGVLWRSVQTISQTPWMAFLSKFVGSSPRSPRACKASAGARCRSLVVDSLVGVAPAGKGGIRQDTSVRGYSVGSVARWPRASGVAQAK